MTYLVPLPALLASQAAVCEPLDPDSVSDLEVGLGVVSDRGNVAGALMASDERELSERGKASEKSRQLDGLESKDRQGRERTLLSSGQSPR